LIQTIGRAARHISGQAILYADNLTESMKIAIEETERRRNVQIAHNKLHKIVPKPIVSKLDNSILEFLEDTRKLNTQQQQLEEVNIQAQEIPLDSLPEIIQLLEEQMKRSAKELEFEKAAQYRDKIKQLRERL